MSQNTRLRTWLDSGKPITAKAAAQELGIARLAARVYDLRAAGYPVMVEQCTVATRYGRAKIARYTKGRK